MSTQVKNVKRAKYPSDISKNGWKKLKRLLPLSQYGQSGVGRPPVDLKEVINGVFYVVKTGCSWRSLPHDFPRWSTVYGYRPATRFNRWSREGTWQWPPWRGYIRSLSRKSDTRCSVTCDLVRLVWTLNPSEPLLAEANIVALMGASKSRATVARP